MSYTTYDFALGILASGGWPMTASNISFLEQWQRREGGTAGGKNNPLNSKQKLGDSTPLPNGIQQYGDPNAGAVATANTITNGYYPDLVAALKAGNASDADASGALAPDLSKWSNGGYTNVTGEPTTPTVIDPNTDSFTNESGAVTQGLNLPNPVAGLSSWTSYLAKIGSWLTLGKNWIRIGEMVAGIALSAIGLILMFKGKGALPIPIPI